MARGKTTGGKAIAKHKSEGESQPELDPSNERKQKKRKQTDRTKTALKKLNFNVSEAETAERYGNKSPAQPNKRGADNLSNNLTKTSSKFTENGDEVLFEVEGQATEFSEEIENEDLMQDMDRNSMDS